MKENGCELCAYKTFAEEITAQNNCNNCAKAKTCNDIPKWGDYCRINCKDWSDVDDPTKTARELRRAVNSTTDVQEACAIGYNAGYAAGKIAGKNATLEAVKKIANKKR